MDSPPTCCVLGHPFTWILQHCSNTLTSMLHAWLMRMTAWSLNMNMILKGPLPPTCQLCHQHPPPQTLPLHPNLHIHHMARACLQDSVLSVCTNKFQARDWWVEYGNAEGQEASPALVEALHAYAEGQVQLQHDLSLKFSGKWWWVR